MRAPFAPGAAWYLPRFLTLAVALFGVTFFIYYSDVNARALLAAFKPEIDPSFTGGRIAAVVFDPLGDDHGYGALSYPTHRAFAPGSLDLLRYAVHEPVWGARWQEYPEYWQIDLSFASGPPEVRAVRIYVDSDGDGRGAADTPGGNAEGVALDPLRPWDWRIALDGLSGTVVSADGKTSIPVGVTALDGGKTVRARIPLSDPSLRFLFGSGKTWHYVLVGPWSPWARGGIMGTAKRAAADRSGGAQSPYTPAVFDLLAPDPGVQERLLSSWNGVARTLPKAVPVEIPLKPEPGADAPASADPALIAELEARAAAEAAIEREEAASRWEEAASRWEEARLGGGGERSPAALLAYAAAAFDADALVDARKALDELLALEPDNPAALAYRGALEARTAEAAMPLAAVAIVEEAYRLMDRGVDLAEGPAQALVSRLCRGNVSLAVPETVFGKRGQGAEDFLAAAEAYTALGGPSSGVSAAECLLKAALCLADAGRDMEAGTWLRESFRLAEASEAAERGSVPASLALSLARKGFMPTGSLRAGDTGGRR